MGAGVLEAAVSDEQEYVGREPMEPEGYLQPTRYKITCRCLRCGNEYHWFSTKVSGQDRPCPKKKCKEAAMREQIIREQANMARILETQTPPGHIGANASVKAVDTTADIVMTDYGFTDLKDNIRTGEAMAPKLPGPQQAAADNFFNANPLRDRGVGSRQAELLKRRAIAGAFRGMAINPTQVTPGSPGESPMRLVRREGDTRGR
jgi:hypothetical protein